jgi:RNA polymerase sigma-70 factor (ECF subfamily)
MERLAAGDETALACAYDLYSSRVYGLAIRILRDPSQAEEVTQDVFVTAWRHRAAFDPTRGSLGAWLMTATRNRAIDLIRAHRGRQEVELGLQVEIQDPANVEETVLLDLDQKAVTEAVAALPHPQRHAIELAYFAGRTGPEIARASGVPLSTVKGRIRLGLQRLAHDLELRSATGMVGA